jgi:hypothetical protein
MIILAYVTPRPGGARHETSEQPTTERKGKQRKTNITSTFDLSSINIYIPLLG